MTTETAKAKPSAYAKCDRLIQMFEKWEQDYVRASQNFQSKLSSAINVAAIWEQSDTVLSLAPRRDLAVFFQTSIRQAVFNGMPENEIINNLREVAMTRALEKARAPKRSSSVVSNYVDGEEGRAYAEIVSELRFGY